MHVLSCFDRLDVLTLSTEDKYILSLEVISQVVILRACANGMFKFYKVFDYTDVYRLLFNIHNDICAKD